MLTLFWPGVQVCWLGNYFTLLFVCYALMWWLGLRAVIKYSGCLETRPPKVAGEAGCHEGTNAEVSIEALSAPSWMGRFTCYCVSETCFWRAQSEVREESWVCPLRWLAWPCDLSEPQLPHVQNSDNNEFCSSRLLGGSNTLNSSSPSTCVN